MGNIHRSVYIIQEVDKLLQACAVEGAHPVLIVIAVIESAKGILKLV